MTAPLRLPALALSGSNPTGDAAFSCALRTADGLFPASSPAGQRGDLATLVAELCREHAVTAADLRELRIDLGPGSYTGLRVAVTFARLLRLGEDLDQPPIPVLGTDSLSLMVRCSCATDETRQLRPVLDARMGHFHTGTFYYAAQQLQLAQAPLAVPAAALATMLQPAELLLAPASLLASLAAIAAATGCTPQAASRTTAAGLFLPGLPLQELTPAELLPRYLLGSYAEQGKAQ